MTSCEKPLIRQVPLDHEPAKVWVTTPRPAESAIHKFLISEQQQLRGLLAQFGKHGIRTVEEIGGEQTRALK